MNDKLSIDETNNGSEERRKEMEKKKKKKKRGLKPRSKRNRKRPRSHIHSNDDLVVRSKVIALQLDGEEILTTSTTTGNNNVGTKKRRYVRTIEPYPYTFATYAKSRWLGRTLLDVYSTEFGSYPVSYYRTAIQQGRILVSDNRVDIHYKIKGNDVLTHTVHRHEPAVAVSYDEPPYLRIIKETDDLVVIDKPATIPIHPCGGYHENSLMNMLEKDASTNYGKLYTIHRLDRLVSGCVLLAKSSSVAAEWGKLLKGGDRSTDPVVEKIYVAKVKGKFLSSLVTKNNNNCEKIPRIGLVGDDVDYDNDDDDDTSKKSPLIPIGGEWPSSSSSAVAAAVPDAATTTSEAAADTKRRLNAHGYWITDARTGNVRNDISIEHLIRISNGKSKSNNLEDWMHLVLNYNNTSDTTTNNNNNNKEDSNDDDDPGLYWFHLACPTRIEQPKIGVCKSGTFDDIVDDLYVRTVKPAETSFAFVGYDATGDASIVLCRPRTGRTHQIRIHLQYLGHSIANDPNYGGSMWYNNPKGLEVCQRAQGILDSLGVVNNNESTNNAVEANPGCSLSTTSSAAAASLVTTDVPATKSEVETLARIQRTENESLDAFIKRTCVWCARSNNGSNNNNNSKNNIDNNGSSIIGSIHEDRSVLEFLVRSSGIWLHALQYSIGCSGDGGGTKVTREKKTSFRTEFPEWANL